MADDGVAARNLAWADALVAGLHDGGVRHAVVAPGSRSTPLVLALVRRTELTLTVLPDERAAAFFALGLGRHDRRPALFACTSGSAVANAFPALLEAEADAVPLLLVSADRPAELQQTGANQTMDQVGLFGRHVRHAAVLPPPVAGVDARLPYSCGLRAAEAARWPVPGPVHVNVAFREPLVPDSLPAPAVGPQARPAARPALTPAPAAVTALAASVAGRPGLIVCGRGETGPDFPRAITALAARLGAPILADPLSGLRWGAHDRHAVLTAYDLILRGAPGPAPDWILQFGATPVSAALGRYLAGSPAPLTLVAPAGDWQDPARRAVTRIIADGTALADALAANVDAPADPAWLDGWRRAEAEAVRLAREPELRPPEAGVVAALEAGLGAGAPLFVGNSLPIRAVDAFARGREAPLAVHGNRGLSGIDGNVSTALGVGFAAGVRPTALLGDLTLYHDTNGLLATRAAPADLIVLDNGGGGIFALLPQAGLPGFERLWLTPTGLDLARVAALYDLDYSPVDEPASYVHAVGAGSASRLIHLRIDRDESTRRFRRLFQAAAGLGGER